MARVNIDKAKLERMLYEPKMAEVTAAIAEELIAAAKLIYISQDVDGMDHDYMNSFEIEKHGKGYIVRNTADTAFWVEFGAHAGGKTPVLGYAPLRRAIDAVASEQA